MKAGRISTWGMIPACGGDACSASSAEFVLVQGPVLETWAGNGARVPKLLSHALYLKKYRL